LFIEQTVPAGFGAVRHRGLSVECPTSAKNGRFSRVRKTIEILRMSRGYDGGHEPIAMALY
jgi:hypothetical protein